MEIPAIVGGGLVVIGAGIGIGRIGGSSLYQYLNLGTVEEINQSCFLSKQ